MKTGKAKWLGLLVLSCIAMGCAAQVGENEVVEEYEPDVVAAQTEELTATALDEDSDRDGVRNTLDQCLDSVEDLDGYQDNDGCPEVLFQVFLPRPHRNAIGGIPACTANDRSCNLECFINTMPRPQYCMVVPYQPGMAVDTRARTGTPDFGPKRLRDFTVKDTNAADNRDPVPAILTQGAMIAMIDGPVPGPADAVALGYMTIRTGAVIVTVMMAAKELGILNSILALPTIRMNPAIVGLGEIIAALKGARTNSCPQTCEQRFGVLQPRQDNDGKCHWPCGIPHIHHYEWHMNPRSCQCRMQETGAPTCIPPNNTSMCCGPSWGVECGPNLRPVGYQPGSGGGGGGGGAANLGGNTVPNPSTGTTANGMVYSPRTGGTPSTNSFFRYDCTGSQCIGSNYCTSNTSGTYMGSAADCISYIKFYCGEQASGTCTRVQ